MQATRRTFLSSLGAVTVAHAAGWAATKPARSGPQFYVAALTPVDRKGRFEEGLARDLLAYLQNHGVDGVLVLGTTGEFSSFSVAERKKILEVMVQHHGNLDVMCQVGTPNLPETLELLDHAARTGADKALVLPPYYYKNPSVEGLEAFYAPVLEKARIPVLLYHIPATSGVPITPELVRRLSRYEKLYGIKDSSGNQQGLLDSIREFTKLKILTGSPRLISMALQSGGGGAITGNGNVIPAETAAVFREYRAGNDLAAAQARLDAAAKVFPSDIPKMKFALGELGLRETYCRPPFTELKTEEKAELQSRIASAGRS
jgi:4-hydroxy-tetrahydrodipicolinate synthase